MSHRIHSYYTRTPQDLPISGQTVQLVLRVRRFRCLNPCCGQQTFAERIPKVVLSHARHTSRLGSLLDAVAFALSAQAVERLSKHLRIEISADTLLRRVKQASMTSFRTPRLLGVDDFAFRRERYQGTKLLFGLSQT